MWSSLVIQLWCRIGLELCNRFDALSGLENVGEDDTDLLWVCHKDSSVKTVDTKEARKKKGGFLMRNGRQLMNESL